jgi:hypothetical protein
MAESFRRMLRREYVPICAGELPRWSARALSRVSRFLHRDAGDGDEETRRVALAEEIVAGIAHHAGRDPDDVDAAVESISESESVIDLESRAWLLGHADDVDRADGDTLVVHETRVLPGRVDRLVISGTLFPDLSDDVFMDPAHARSIAGLMAKTERTRAVVVQCEWREDDAVARILGARADVVIFDDIVRESFGDDANQALTALFDEVAARGDG